MAQLSSTFETIVHTLKKYDFQFVLIHLSGICSKFDSLRTDLQGAGFKREKSQYQGRGKIYSHESADDDSMYVQVVKVLSSSVPRNLCLKILFNKN